MFSSQDTNDGVCVVCFKSIEIFSIGECDHPVCFECSTRMRVLCLKTECPICRHDLSKVIFTSMSQPFKNLDAKPYRISLFEKKYKICFADENVKGAYQKLLEHHCKKCDENTPPFKNLESLKEHLRKEHEVYFCDLCVQNLKIFTSERKCYTRQQLGFHRRKGDPDDTSHKGHPLCEFCDTRYMDTDELFRHLRKDHLYCHLCDADGYHRFYGSYSTLKDHFRRDHYLCEEGECGEQNLTGVFRSDIDLKAHKASEHGRGLSKQAARQARTLELQFTLTPRPNLPRTHHRPDRMDQEIVHENLREEPPPPVAPIPYVPPIDTGSTKHFPTLGDSSTPVLSLGRPDKVYIRQSSGALARTDENFPALSLESSAPTNNNPTSTSFRVNITHQSMPGPSGAIIRSSAKPNVSIQVHNRPQSSSNRFSLTETTNRQLAMKLADEKQQLEANKRFMEEFPSLSKKDRSLLLNDFASYQSPTSYQNHSSSIAKKISATPTPPSQVAPAPKPAVSVPAPAPPPPTLDAFPALQPSAVPPAQPQWITSKAKDSQPKASKTVTVPPKPKPSINDLAQFPAPPVVSSQPHWVTARSKEQMSKSSKAASASKTPYSNNSPDSSTPPSSQLQWVAPKSKEQSNKASKVAPAPQIPTTPSLNDSSDFPSLKSSKQKNKKIEKSAMKSVDESFNISNNNNNNNKKDKKKNKPTDNCERLSDTTDFNTKDRHGDKENTKNGMDSNTKKKNNPSEKKNISPKNGQLEDSFKNMCGINASVNKSGNKTLTHNEDQYSSSIHNPSEFKFMKNAPPPGFDNRFSSQPPMFAGSVPPCNGFTFTSSSGQSYNIPAHNYVQPFNFNERNKLLVTKFMEILDNPATIQDFKQLSQLFREGSYSAESYYIHCLNLMGSSFEEMFPELLVLLPDISKQQELYKVYVAKTKFCLEICEICGQVLNIEDAKPHTDFHDMQSAFPALGSPLASLAIARHK